jgi:hypothetical protein
MASVIATIAGRVLDMPLTSSWVADSTGPGSGESGGGVDTTWTRRGRACRHV